MINMSELKLKTAIELKSKKKAIQSEYGIPRSALKKRSKGLV